LVPNRWNNGNYEKKKVADDGKKWLASNNTLDNLKDKK
jgi:hypothetical protein